MSMGKHRRSEGENDLPEAMIQHIQSFMSGKEAARTTILSKSWYNAWLTRPNLVFDQCYFREYCFVTNSEEFSKFSSKTLKRYRDLNLKIDSFEFQMPSNSCRSLANELTVEAIKMGATDVSLEIFPTSKFVLPGDVLQSESLNKLSVMGCKMEMESVKVNCSTLKYLRLFGVFLEGDLLWDIISSCRLIEGLELRRCKFGLKKRRKHLNLSKGFELHKLKTLFLEKVKLCGLFFSDFSSKFPFLKDLSVHKCSGYKKIQIYSQSLEFISFKHFRTIFKANFDVPNLRKFCYEGESSFPSVSFPYSCNWESNVSISECNDDRMSTKWFLNLNKLLRNLSLSKVSLNLRSPYCLSIIDKAENTACLPRPLVEKLTIDLPASDCATTLLDSLIQWCHPTFVTLNLLLFSSIDVIESQEIVHKILMQQRKSDDDLEEISVDVFDVAVSEWRTIPCKSLLDISTSHLAKQISRLHLKWGQQTRLFSLAYVFHFCK